MKENLMWFKNFTFFILLSISTFSYSDNWILVTGGSGYIGSSTSLYLAEQNNKVIILDKKAPQGSYLSKVGCLFDSKENKQLNPKNSEVNALNNIFFVQGDYADEALLDKIFTNYKIEAVVHFAGFIEAQASVKDPLSFYENNVVKTITLLKKMLFYKVNKFIFSSSAAVYGNAKEMPIKENCLRMPINPYGQTKCMLEFILEDFVKAYNLQAVALRYFNAAGAMPEYDLGERHENETHLIPILLDCIHNNKEFKIFGDTYKTKDGTCIRDYIHIKDLARAHYLALKYLNENNSIKFEPFNLGSGIGYSVKEIVEIAKKVTNKNLKYSIVGKREGDPDILTCNIEKAQTILNWKPEHSDIQKLISDANSFYVSNYLQKN